MSRYVNMPISRIAIGNRDEATQPGAVKAALAEFISTVIFVFAGQGSGIAYSENSPLLPIFLSYFTLSSLYSLGFSHHLMFPSLFHSLRFPLGSIISHFALFLVHLTPCVHVKPKYMNRLIAPSSCFNSRNKRQKPFKRVLTQQCAECVFEYSTPNKLTGDGAATPAGLVAASLAHAFALFVAVSVGANNSGGHVNPAVTFGAFLGGNITLIRGILYWIAQLLGSTVACFLLRYTTGLPTGTFALVEGCSVWNGLVLEIVMTFGLVYTVYATAIDPKKGSIGTIAPIAIGFIVGANILIGGAFSGASMNPAIAFGPALVSWSWASHWVYWAGPLIGGGLAGIVYEIFFIDHNSHEPLPSADY